MCIYSIPLTNFQEKKEGGGVRIHPPPPPRPVRYQKECGPERVNDSGKFSLLFALFCF